MTSINYDVVNAAADEGPSRTSMPLTEQDKRDLAVMAQRPERLSELPGSVTTESSKATMVHAIFEEGMRVMKEREMEEIYQRIGQQDRQESAERHARLKGRNRGGSDQL